MSKKPPPPLGTINGYIKTPLWANGQYGTFDGTTVGMAVSAHALGSRVGDTVTAWGMSYTMVPDGGGDRTPDGVWMTKTAWLNAWAAKEAS